METTQANAHCLPYVSRLGMEQDNPKDDGAPIRALT